MALTDWIWSSPEPAGSVLDPILTGAWAPGGRELIGLEGLPGFQGDPYELVDAWKQDQAYQQYLEYLVAISSVTPPRSLPDQPGTVIPRPYGRLDTTASFPAGASAQTPIVSGSRAHFLYGADGTLDGRVKQGDPFGFVVPIRHDSRRVEAVAAATAGRAGRRALDTRAREDASRRTAARLRSDLGSRFAA